MWEDESSESNKETHRLLFLQGSSYILCVTEGNIRHASCVHHSSLCVRLHYNDTLYLCVCLFVCFRVRLALLYACVDMYGNPINIINHILMKALCVKYKCDAFVIASLVELKHNVVASQTEHGE